MIQNVLSIIGLSMTALGAGASAKGVLITTRTAEMLSGTYWDQNLPLRDALIRQSRWAAGGLGLITIGTVLQIAAIACSQ